MKTDRKAQGFTVGSLAQLAVILITVGLVFAYGLDAITDVGDDFASGSDEKLAIGNATEAINKLSTKLPTIAGIIAVVVIIFYVGLMRRAV